MNEPTYGIRPQTDFTALLDVLRQYRIIGFDDDPTGPRELAVMIRTRRKPARPVAIEIDDEEADEPDSEDVAGLSAAAVHEAGHAVAYLATELPGTLDYISIGKRGAPGSLGRTYFRRSDENPENDYAEKLAIAAGAIAELQILGTKTPGGDASDKESLLEMGGLDLEGDENAHLLVAECRSLIIALARELDKRTAMTGDQVAVLLRGLKGRDEESDDTEEADDADQDLSYEHRDGEFDSELPYTARSN